jgi:lycopene cyclase domain-containing protein
LTYLLLESYLIGGVAVTLWAFHFRYLWTRRWRILLGICLVLIYALPLDALAVAYGWGGFNPAYVSGVYFFNGSLLLEEIIFWAGTSLVTLSAVMIFAELERRGVPWWALPAGVLLPIDCLADPASAGHRHHPGLHEQPPKQPRSNILGSTPHNSTR